MGKDAELLEAARNGNFQVVEKILSSKAKRSGPLARKSLNSTFYDKYVLIGLTHPGLAHGLIRGLLIRVLLTDSPWAYSSGSYGLTPGLLTDSPRVLLTDSPRTHSRTHPGALLTDSPRGLLTDSPRAYSRTHPGLTHSPGLTLRLTHGLTPGLTHGLTPGLLTDSPRRFTHGLTHPGSYSRTHPGLTHGLTHPLFHLLGLTPGLTHGLRHGLIRVLLTDSLTPGLTQLTDSLTDLLTDSLTHPGLTHGLTPGLTHGLTLTTHPGSTHGLTPDELTDSSPGLTHGLTHPALLTDSPRGLLTDFNSRTHSGVLTHGRTTHGLHPGSYSRTHGLTRGTYSPGYSRLTLTHGLTFTDSPRTNYPRVLLTDSLTHGLTPGLTHGLNGLIPGLTQDSHPALLTDSPRVLLTDSLTDSPGGGLSLTHSPPNGGTLTDSLTPGTHGLTGRTNDSSRDSRGPYSRTHPGAYSSSLSPFFWSHAPVSPTATCV
ncbi:hypothetical protein C7M84_009729 [Penaeus vannamei]|uniref:Uncharacterized protein n=1 Tax=Penaeus vannamei TaxID=6689 RepID=A0A3R7PN87_PENVA|nr:hypothetical protein C7M84_009729 [Penaeus vannamei]